MVDQQPPTQKPSFTQRLKGFAGNTAGNLIQKAGGKVIKKALTKHAPALALKLGIGAGAAAAGVAAGTAAGPVGWAAMAAGLVKKAAKWVAAKIIGGLKSLFSSRATEENKKLRWAAWAAALLGGIGLIQAGFTGIGSALSAIGGLGAVGELALSAKAIGTTTATLGQTIMAGLTSVTVPAIGIPAIGGLVAAPAIIAIYLFIINSGAYIVPQAPKIVPGLVESPYIGIEKVANPAGPFDNGNLPLTITYTITVTAKKGSLMNISFEYNCTVIKDGPSPSCPSPSPAIPSPPAIISVVDPFTFTYTQRYTAPSFEDTLVIDTFTVTADADEQAGIQAAASASIKIGNPPEECPDGWPVHGRLTQGAYGPYTHSNAEAIDISNVTGTPVTARHSGIVRAIDAWPYGKHVEITSDCNGTFFSRYAHLSVTSVQTGSFVTMGQQIGLVGSTGNSTGAHLHYEFRGPSGPKSYPSNPPYMMPIFVPKELPRQCTTYEGCGSVSIP